MEIAALPLSRPQLVTQSSFAMRLSAFLALMKPRVMLLAVFTAIVVIGHWRWRRRLLPPPRRLCFSRGIS